MPIHIDYSVTVPVSVDDAFRAFQNLDRLLHRGIYAEAVWTEGEPWKVGSRIRYELLVPMKATISAVVAAISPPRSVNLIDHALGVTAQQHVTFGPDLKGGTRIRMTMELVGQSTELSESDLKHAATFITHDALDTIVEFCKKEQIRRASGD